MQFSAGPSGNTARSKSARPDLIPVAKNIAEAIPVDEGRKGHGTITTLVRCPNPKCDSQDFWVEEEKMHRFRVPKGISDIGYFDESAIKKARVLLLDSFSPRTSQQ